MNNCKCVECTHQCYEYYNNSTSDKAYYEWSIKEEKCEKEDKQNEKNV